MNIDSKKTPFSDVLWQQLSGASATDVCTRAKVRSTENNNYEISFLNKFYRTSCADRQILDPSGNPVKSGDFVLLLLTYLLNAKDIALQNIWVSEKDLPQGSFFFRGPHSLPTQQFLKRYGDDAKSFIALGESNGGTVMPGYGDACIRLQVLSRIPMACILWVGDDEFPARLNYMFDPTVVHHFALDVILAMVYSVVHTVVPR